MAMFDLATFEAIEASPLGQLVRHSTWIFPVTEALHLLALCLLGGALFTVDLRLLGVGLTGQPVRTLVRGSQRWLVASVVFMMATGALLFVSEAVKCYHNPSFWVKAASLPVALAYTGAARAWLARRAHDPAPAMQRLLATGSIALWFTVAMAGRWISFSS